VQRRFAVLDRGVVTAARILALRLDLADRVLAAAAGLEVTGLAAALRSLRDEGLLVPDGDRMIPAVATAVLGKLPAAERRRIHDAVAGSLIAAGNDPARRHWSAAPTR
jgi:2-methylcitrate dehydratase PrpD